MPISKQLPHLIIPARVERTDFAPVRPFFDMSDRPQLTARQQRYLHANQLNEEVDRAVRERVELIQSFGIGDTEVTPGICLEVQSSNDITLDFDALENRRSRSHPVELLNVRHEDGSLRATIFVPQKRLDSLKKQIRQYGDETLDPEGTKGSTIAVDSIEAFKLADLGSFWMEDTPLPADVNQPHTFEAWLRKGAADSLRMKQERFGIKVSPHSILFQETEICLLTCSLQTLSVLQIATASLVAFRYREQAPGFFTALPPADQADWTRELVARIKPIAKDAPAVCVLDTGVRRTHHLLNDALSEKDCDSYDPASWGTDDHDGHGTEMAGLALYGDLTPLLAENYPIGLKHRLESIKILPVTGQNPEELYGWITQESAARAVVNAPNRKRVFCLAVTSGGRNTNGKPTGWSAMIDKLSMGVSTGNESIEDKNKKLFVVSVGNIRDELKHGEYSARNDLEPVENPAQAWNALSVGGITHKAFSEDSTLDGWELIAQPGDIAPTSRTSVSWEEKDWPIKPDIVLEGGNCVSDGTMVSHDADLALLTTGRDVPLVYSCETSAATAQAARMAAIIQAEYSDLWPETLRGLLVHSARWHQSMYRNKSFNHFKGDDKANLLRRFGYGMPDLELARYSASNRACMIVQSEIQPFSREEGAQNAGYRDMNIHTLPWPADVLRENSLVGVRLRVTLSYFIEPNPAERLPTLKYSYASHRLRFELQRPHENIEKLRQRLNKKDRPEEYNKSPHQSSPNWQLGTQARNKGSLVSDVWTGTAAELAEQNTIVIMPEGGWWKYRKHLNRANQKARYALIVSLETESQELDIYTPIRNQIDILTAITT